MNLEVSAGMAWFESLVTKLTFVPAGGEGKGIRKLLDFVFPSTSKISLNFHNSDRLSLCVGSEDINCVTGLAACK
jgi:hypothetical protein